ncbi:MAG: PilW family protein [Gammaproteobacteria bacterium]|nr:PilW family protein [Gammaproteobacteria bacterium]
MSVATIRHEAGRRGHPGVIALGGFSLIELLVSMAMALTLANGVLQIYLGSTILDRNQVARARMLENGRLAIHLLAQDMRLAGALGCLPELYVGDVTSTLQREPDTLQPARGIEGWEAATSNASLNQSGLVDVPVVSTSTGHWTGSAGSALEETFATPNSDIVRVWQAASTGATLASSSGAQVLTLQGSGSPEVAGGEILLLSDCMHADWVQACDVQSRAQVAVVNTTQTSACSPGNDPAKDVQSRVGGEVLRLQSSVFYVGKRGDLATNPPALFRRPLNRTAVAGAAEELVEGIARMQLQFGIDLDVDSLHSVDAYVTADLVPDWQRVISIRISLLVQSVEDNLLPAPQAYQFDGITYDGMPGNGSLPPDTRLRQEFTTTVALRARLAGVSLP